MTGKELELMTGLYALLDRIDAEDKATAILIAEHLLNVLQPLSPPLATDVGSADPVAPPPSTPTTHH